MSEMKRLNSFLIAAVSLLSTPLAYGQYCTAVGPSSTIDSNVESAIIIGEGGSFISFTGCPGVVGLDDQTLTHSVDLLANGTYSLDLQFGTCGNNYAGVGEAWIDFNGDETFDASESIGTWTGTPPVPVVNFVFTVPTNVTNGATRMRVIQAEGLSLPIDPCANYTWGSTIDFEVVLSGGSGAQYCSNVGPASSGDSNIQSVYLAGEGGSSISFTGCPGVIGLDDQTMNHSVDLAKGANYTAEIVFGTCGGVYGGVGSAWIDFNRDSTFQSSELIGTWQGTPPQQADLLFNVPLTASDGSTRMRVVQWESGALPLDPCGSFTWGSTTDFEVVIGGTIDCSGYVGDDMTDPRIVSSLPFTETYNNSVCFTNNVPVYNSADVFYRLTPQDYGVSSINVSLCGSLIDTYLQVQDTGSNVLWANDDYAPCAPSSEVSFFVGSHDTLYVVVQGWNNQEGDYTISINDGSTVSVEEIEQAISIFPNPAQNQFSIQGISTPYTVEIYNSLGQLILAKDFETSQKIETSHLKDGLYLIKVLTEGVEHLEKLIIER